MLEVGHEKQKLIVFISELETLIREHMEEMTVAELIGAIESVKFGFMAEQLLSE